MYQVFKITVNIIVTFHVFHIENRLYIIFYIGYVNLWNKSIVRFERIVSGRFSPLTAPLPLTRPPAPLPLRLNFSSPTPALQPLIWFLDPFRSISRSRFAHMLLVVLFYVLLAYRAVATTNCRHRHYNFSLTFWLRELDCHILFNCQKNCCWFS